MPRRAPAPREPRRDSERRAAAAILDDLEARIARLVEVGGIGNRRLALLEGDLQRAEGHQRTAQAEKVGAFIRSGLPQVLVTLAEEQWANPALWAENRPRLERLLARLKAG